MTVARSDLVDPLMPGIYHCWARCVRRAYLCGNDPYTGQNFEHRRGWVRDRLKLLAKAFGVEVFTYAVMSNHVHLVLRNRPDLAAAWSDREVLDRWAMVYPTGGQASAAANPAEPVRAVSRLGKAGIVTAKMGSPTEDLHVNANADRDGHAACEARIEVLRRRLCDISWLMKALNEFIARRANREDDCRGRFWESRFKCQRLLDEAAVVTCMTYVDLNPIRARMAESLADPQFTGAYDRIQAKQGRARLAGFDELRPQRRQADGSLTRAQLGLLNRETVAVSAADWLASLDSEGSPLSNMTEASYLDLLDWTGRQIRADKPGHIPESLAPLLTQLGMNTDKWLSTVDRYGSLFYRLVGRVERMIEYAGKLGRRFYRGLTASREAFAATPQPT